MASSSSYGDEKVSQNGNNAEEGEGDDGTWSNSLLRAANVICERISASSAAGVVEQHANLNNNAKSATLPPRPPMPRVKLI